MLTGVVVEAWLTTCGELESLPLLVAKVESPLYVAVTVWVPTARDDVVKVAFADPFRVTLDARVVAPSVKVDALLPVREPANLEVWRGHPPAPAFLRRPWSSSARRPRSSRPPARR